MQELLQKMPAKQGYHKRRAVVEKIESELEGEIEEISPLVEEKFSQITPLPDDDQLIDTMNKYTVRRDQEHGGNKPHAKNKMNLPEALKAMPDGKEKKERIKAAAQASLLLGQSIGSVAIQYGLDHAQVSDWNVTVATAQAIGRRDRLGDMILVYIEQEFKSLIAISMVTSEESWVRRQDADALAHYIAVKSDRLMLLLQAFGRVESSRKAYVDRLESIEQNNG
jgi:hypothetical protein